MKAIIAAAALVIGSAVVAHADDPMPNPTPKMMPPEVRVKIQAPEGTSEEDIAAGIAAENARRDPAAQAAARGAKAREAETGAHHTRVNKICDSIPEKALADDPSLRRMCGE